MPRHPALQWLGHALRREPLYRIASITLLSLGIAALGATLALYRGTLAQPPPLANWERLAVLRGVTAQNSRLPLSFPDVEDLRRDVSAFADIALTRAATVTLEDGEGLPQRIAAARVTPNLAAVLGVSLHGGAGFDVALGQPADQVIISERLWNGLLGRQPLPRLRLRVGGRAVAVVGVLPRGVRFPSPDIDLWLPLAPVGNEARRDYAFTTPWALLDEAQTLGEAQQQLDLRVAALAAAFPQSHAGLRVEAIRAAEDSVAAHRPLVALFALVAALVFVAVAGNVAALAAARALARRGETATRLALGATPRRLFGESLRSAATGGAAALLAGTLLAAAIVRAAEAAEAESFTALRATIDAAVLAGTLLGATLLLAAQLLPALWMQRRLGGAGPAVARTRGSSADRGAVAGAGLLVALQLALCFATVGTLALAAEALAARERADLGFAVDGRYSLALGVPELDHAATVAGFTAAIAELDRLPGFDEVAVISRLPLLRGASSVGLVPASVGLPGDTALPVDARLLLGPAERALGLRLQRGRFLADGDRADAPPVVVIDRRFADQWFAGRNPLGARIRLQIDPSIAWTIVGVIDPVRWRAHEDGEAPALLLPAAQFTNIAPMRNAQLVWRGEAAAAADRERLRGALRRGMPLLSADSPRALAELVAEASTQPRLAKRLLRLLAAMALLLALLGVGALLLYRHERQRRALGIRLCLGASRQRLIGSSLADGALLALAGGLVGSTLLLALGRVPDAARLLPADGHAAALAAAAAVVLLLATIGGLAPAWRIARLQPSAVLHDGG